VAYGGPARMETVRNWLNEIHHEEAITVRDLPTDPTTRYSVAAPSVDGVFILGKGFVQFDNLPIGFVHPEARGGRPDLWYYIGSTADGTLFVFFMFLTNATAGVFAESPKLDAYLAGFGVQVDL